MPNQISLLSTKLSNSLELFVIHGKFYSRIPAILHFYIACYIFLQNSIVFILFNSISSNSIIISLNYLIKFGPAFSLSSSVISFTLYTSDMSLNYLQTFKEA
jgi:hypothetical protein